MKPPPFEPASPAERAALAPAIGDPRTWPAASWPDPQPLPEGLAPVAPFDYAMLPDRLRPWVQDVAEREIDASLIAATVEGIADIRASAEGREGVQSFLQKRKPGWL